MNKRKSVIALFLSIVLLISIIFSLGYIVERTDHNCIGSNCQICVNIYSFVHWLQELCACFGILLFCVVGVVFCKYIKNFIYIFNFKTTLVSLKIKLSC